MGSYFWTLSASDGFSLKTPSVSRGRSQWVEMAEREKGAKSNEREMRDEASKEDRRPWQAKAKAAEQVRLERRGRDRGSGRRGFVKREVILEWTKRQ